MPGRTFSQEFANNGLVASPFPPLTFGMCYEFDEPKDRINREKHGYALASGEDLLRRLTLPGGVVPPIVAVETPGRDDGEARFRVLFLDHESQLVDFVYTVRGTVGNWIDEYRMRAISYRRAYEADLFVFFESQVSLAECLAWMQRCVNEGLAPEVVAWPLTEAVDGPRRAFLARPAQIFVLADQLVANAVARLTPGDPLERAEDRDAEGFARVCVELEATTDVGRGIIDYLFNGSRGLRYYYAIAPVMGALVSRRVIEKLMPLVEAELQNLGAEHTGRAFHSLRGATAKVWPEEEDLLLQDSADAVASIAVPLWQRNCERWRADGREASYLACRGIQTPIPGRLQIKGAFVDTRRNEWVLQQKEHRSHEIHQWGWT